VRLDFTLRSDERTKKLWPHDFVLHLRFRLGQTCDITLEAHGDYESTGALHSYYNVGAIDGVKVTGLGVPYTNVVDGTRGSQDGALTYPGRVDHVYTAPGDISRIEDPALNRVIEVSHHHHSDVVSWNPGPELSKSMADLTDEGYKEFVCVETARISEPMTSTTDRPATLAVTITIAH
jgi:glucose-6-phosphate 1-epimerase